MSVTTNRVESTACSLTIAVCCVSLSTVASVVTLSSLSNRSFFIWRAQANTARRKSACGPPAPDNRRPSRGPTASLNCFAFERPSAFAHP
eukprot:4590395-Pleurochrysis_carterae.AAC.1